METHDIFVANSRATRYSNRHLSLYPDSKEYWDFSFTEMGRYDVIANIQAIIKKTQQPKLVYVGYSQGTSQMLYALSIREEEILADTVESFIALSPCFGSETKPNFAI